MTRSQTRQRLTGRLENTFAALKLARRREDERERGLIAEDMSNYDFVKSRTPRRHPALKVNST
jgi:hypothetical protein